MSNVLRKKDFGKIRESLRKREVNVCIRYGTNLILDLLNFI